MKLDKYGFSVYKLSTESCIHFAKNSMAGVIDGNLS